MPSNPAPENISTAGEAFDITVISTSLSSSSPALNNSRNFSFVDLRSSFSANSLESEPGKRDFSNWFSALNCASSNTDERISFFTRFIEHVSKSLIILSTSRPT